MIIIIVCIVIIITMRTLTIISSIITFNFRVQGFEFSSGFWPLLPHLGSWGGNECATSQKEEIKPRKIQSAKNLD